MIQEMVAQHTRRTPGKGTQTERAKSSSEESSKVWKAIAVEFRERISKGTLDSFANDIIEKHGREPTPFVSKVLPLCLQASFSLSILAKAGIFLENLNIE